MKPKFTKPSQFLGGMRQALIKGVEDRKLFEYLKSEKLLSRLIRRRMGVSRS